MPYSVGAKGSSGCSGYPAIKTSTGEVMGCHETKAEAVAQIQAIAISEAKASKQWEKADFTEGDFALGVSEEEVYVGQVVHVMREGMLGVPGSDMTIEATAEDPAILIRIFEQDEEEGYWEECDKFVAFKANMATKIDPLMTEEEYYSSEISKAEGYSPPSGARAAARRAIKFKEDGKANGAGTAVGWTRAGQLARGETLSLSTVKRMYSYFSRHEVDKKGKDWANQANPSNGYIMWLAWGGDAGFSWSRGIVNREMDKSIFANFGRDYSKVESLSEIFKGAGVGTMVSWNSSGGRAQGKVVRIIRDGEYNVPGTDVTVAGTKDEPAAVIRLYRDGKPTDTLVAHKLGSLTSL